MCQVTTTRGVLRVGWRDGVRQTQFLFIQFTNCSGCFGKASVGNAKQPSSLVTLLFMSRSGTITRSFVFSKRRRLNAQLQPSGSSHPLLAVLPSSSCCLPLPSLSLHSVTLLGLFHFAQRKGYIHSKQLEQQRQQRIKFTSTIHKLSDIQLNPSDYGHPRSKSFVLCSLAPCWPQLWLA